MNLTAKKKQIYNVIENVFQKFSMKNANNINFNKKINIFFDDNKYKKTYISEYTSLLFQFTYLYKPKNQDFINIAQYLYYEIPQYEKIEWIDTSCIGYLYFDYHIDENEFTFGKSKQKVFFYDEDNYKYGNKFIKFCNVLFEITKENKISATFISMTKLKENIKVGDSHLIILISSFEKGKIVLYLYDPNGIEYYNTIVFDKLLNHISQCLNDNNKKKCEITNDKILNFGIQDFIYKKISDYGMYGYCVVYSHFFLYCVFQVLYFLKKNNIDISFVNIYKTINKSIEIIVKNNKEKDIYNLIINFANIISNNYLNFLKEKIPEENDSFLEFINEKVIKTSKGNIKTFQYVEKQPYVEQKQQSRDLYLELREKKLLPNQLKFDFEECKEHDDCLSKECKYGKCMPLSFNRKLEILENGKY